MNNSVLKGNVSPDKALNETVVSAEQKRNQLFTAHVLRRGIGITFNFYSGTTQEFVFSKCLEVESFTKKRN